MKEQAETHQRGALLVEELDKNYDFKNCDFGLQIAKDGRIWVCIDGRAFLRFLPKKNYDKIKESHD